ncbi:hypothetical protein Caci_4778 [Catenulispora acidiphila DSM 44928]|uniref:Uncharacterized protein n=1 Tax=Catenulispora acidiphila (strain DSM 44928 / JCM 14897 / NBRC 102108 / NRRL B-24433 / ID139908) TaxID=479433 RepID=C7Q1B0_CATAD|nr:hypothetical protein [Catenulispora acidiphila]ACU73639.1 hypothetical protein Caci_4778 [Catenulispora acidiphila DSM 44928]
MSVSKDASLELYLNRGLLFVGSTGDPLNDDELFAILGDRERAASWSDSHVGIVNLPDGILTVSEFDKINTVRRNVGTWGDHRITVRVDDRGEASRVMVIRDCGEAEAPLTSVPGHELPAVTWRRERPSHLAPNSTSSWPLTTCRWSGSPRRSSSCSFAMIWRGAQSERSSNGCGGSIRRRAAS